MYNKQYFWIQNTSNKSRKHGLDVSILLNITKEGFVSDHRHMRFGYHCIYFLEKWKIYYNFIFNIQKIPNRNVNKTDIQQFMLLNVTYRSKFGCQ